MPRLILFFLISLINSTILSASEDKNFSCKWENKNKIPCVEIISLVPNSSDFSKSGISKTIISKKQIEESGAVDLIDVLNCQI